MKLVNTETQSTRKGTEEDEMELLCDSVSPPCLCVFEVCEG